MEKMILALFFLTCPFLLNGQSLQIEFDYQNLDQTISILGKEKVDSVQLSDFLSLKGTKGLYRKIAADSHITRLALLQAVEGRNPRNNYSDFQYIPIRDHLEWMEKFTEELKNNESVILDSLKSGLDPYIPKGTTRKITIHFILGGYSSGFTLGGASDFYVGIQHYKGDHFSIINTCKHELFHLIQDSYYNFTAINTLLEKQSPNLAYLHALVSYLFYEGTAEFVADLHDYPQEARHINELRDHMDVNKSRVEEVFYLISTSAITIYEHPDEANFSNLYNILFSWNWNNPAYFAGYKMTGTLTKEYGTDYLKKALRRDPVRFVLDYTEVAKRSGENLPLFTDEFTNVVRQLNKNIDEINRN